MPELPEVEVTRRGIVNALDGFKVIKVFKADVSLRYPLLDNLINIEGATVTKVQRRAKFIIIDTTKGSLLVHLGMTGHFSVLDYKDVDSFEFLKHDHFALFLDNKKAVVLNDQRRFGLVQWFASNEELFNSKHIKDLAPEPLTDDFNDKYLANKLKNKSVAIKKAIMDNHIVVGVGNIYASECLFLSKINPLKLAKDLTKEEISFLITNIKDVLARSIESGGTTIRDFQGADGKLGYFVQHLNVYGHKGKPCPICQTEIEQVVIGGRSTYFCPHCQK